MFVSLWGIRNDTLNITKSISFPLWETLLRIHYPNTFLPVFQSDAEKKKESPAGTTLNYFSPDGYSTCLSFHITLAISQARKALRALKGLVRLQAIIRGRAVRRQAITALKCLQSVVTIQSQVCARRFEMVEGTRNSHENKNVQDFKDKVIVNLKLQI